MIPPALPRGSFSKFSREWWVLQTLVFETLKQKIKEWNFLLSFRLSPGGTLPLSRAAQNRQNRGSAQLGVLFLHPCLHSTYVGGGGGRDGGGLTP